MHILPVTLRYNNPSPRGLDPKGKLYKARRARVRGGLRGELEGGGPRGHHNFNHGWAARSVLLVAIN